jgi:hypothetical protein
MWVAKHSEPGVGVYVYKTGADNSAVGVYGLGRLKMGVVAAVDGDLVVLNENRGVKTGAAGAVDDDTITNQEIKHGSLHRKW